MTSGFNPQYQQQLQSQTQYMQPPVQNYQTPQRASVGAVEINIMNPTVNPPAANQYLQQNQAPVLPLYPQGSLYNAPYNMQTANYPMNYNNQITYANPYLQNPNGEIKAPKPNIEDENKTADKDTSKADDKKDKKTDDKKTKVILTDDYIKSLENYLNNPEPKIRLMGAKEVMERFKEDKTRKDDAALTALLNKSLQDPSATVRFMALTTLDVGYAQGNNETVQILKNIQSQPDNQYGEDALLASQILLKMSGKTVEVPAQNDSSDKTTKEAA